MSRTSRIVQWMERQVAVGWALAAGTIVLALSAVAPAAHVWWQRAAQAEDDARQRALPVVTMQGELVALRGGVAYIHVWGTKHRECTYMGVQGFSVGPNGQQHDALVVRVDVPEAGRSKPPGLYDIGTWSLAPLVRDAVAVRMYVMHRCAQTSITTMIAHVPLTMPGVP